MPSSSSDDGADTIPSNVMREEEFQKKNDNNVAGVYT